MDCRVCFLSSLSAVFSGWFVQALWDSEKLQAFLDRSRNILHSNVLESSAPRVAVLCGAVPCFLCNKIIKLCPGF